MFKSDEARSMLRAVAFTVALVLVGLVVIGGFAYAASLSIAPATNKVAKERAVTTPLVKDRLTAELPRNKDYRATLPVRRPDGKAKTVVGVVVELPGRGIGIVQGVSFYPVIGDSGVKLKEYRYKVVQAQLVPKENAWAIVQVKEVSSVRVVTPKTVREQPRPIRPEPRPPLRIQPAPDPRAEKVQPLPDRQGKAEAGLAR